MTRILVDIPAKEVKMLDDLAINRSVSRASLIREAVNELIRKYQSKKPLKNMLGALKGEFSIDGVEYTDGVEYQRKLRDEV